MTTILEAAVNIKQKKKEVQQGVTLDVWMDLDSGKQKQINTKGTWCGVYTENKTKTNVTYIIIMIHFYHEPLSSELSFDTGSDTSIGFPPKWINYQSVTICRSPLMCRTNKFAILKPTNLSKCNYNIDKEWTPYPMRNFFNR